MNDMRRRWYLNALQKKRQEKAQIKQWFEDNPEFGENLKRKYKGLDRIDPKDLPF